MTEETSLSLIQSVVDSSKEMTVIFRDEDPILTNSAFNRFFGVTSCEHYKSSFGPFIDNFVPHPSYFNKEKLEPSEKWFDAILKLPEMDRIVSMLTLGYEPHAFSVNIDASISGYYVVAFIDITQDLIKRIMIENNISIDKRSGAYSKKYFLQVAKSYEDAAVFNKKIVATVMIDINKEFIEAFVSQELALRTLVDSLKKSIRQDDMLVQWGDHQFLIVYLTDDEKNTQPMVNKLQILMNSEDMKGLNCQISTSVQKTGETVRSLIGRIGV